MNGISFAAGFITRKAIFMSGGEARLDKVLVRI